MHQKDAAGNIFADSSHFDYFQFFFSVTGNSGRVVLQILYLNLRLIHGAILKHMNISAKHAGKTLTKNSCIR